MTKCIKRGCFERTRNEKKSARGIATAMNTVKKMPLTSCFKFTSKTNVSFKYGLDTREEPNSNFAKVCHFLGRKLSVFQQAIAWYLPHPRQHITLGRDFKKISFHFQLLAYSLASIWNLFVRIGSNENTCKTKRTVWKSWDFYCKNL